MNAGFKGHLFVDDAFTQDGKALRGASEERWGLQWPDERTPQLLPSGPSVVESGSPRIATIDADRQAEIVRAGAAARWEKYYRHYPEKLKERQEREARKTGKVGRPPKPKAQAEK